LNDASSMGLLSFVFRMLTCSRSCLELLLQRSPPRLFTAAAWSGLRPAPESRSRGACPHLSRSFTTPFSVACCPPFLVSLQHTVAQKVELSFRYLTDACLLLVDRKLQLAHDLAQSLQSVFGFAFPAQDHEIVGVGHDTTARASLQPELLPSQHEPAHVNIRQQWRDGRALRSAAPLVSGFGRARLPSSIIG